MTRAEQATVYRGAKRRYFTRAAADRSFAVEAIKRKRCDCDEPGRASPNLSRQSKT
jgi:hypothetical protein